MFTIHDIIIAVIFIQQYLTHKGEHTAPYKIIKKNIYILCSMHNTYTWVHRRNVTVTTKELEEEVAHYHNKYILLITCIYKEFYYQHIYFCIMTLTDLHMCIQWEHYVSLGWLWQHLKLHSCNLEHPKNERRTSEARHWQHLTNKYLGLYRVRSEENLKQEDCNVWHFVICLWK